MVLTAAVISLGSKSSRMTVEAMKKYFKTVEHLNIKHIEVNLGSKEPEVLYKGKPIEHYDCIYPKGSFRYTTLLRAITLILSKKSFIPIKASSFTIGNDKILTHLKLQQNSIPMPRTYLSSSSEAAKEILGKLNYPLIMKFPQGTQGKGVLVVDSLESASTMLDALTALKQPFLIQEYIETGGVDVRAFVIGDRVGASMKRKATSGEKRSNIHAGGKGEGCELDPRTKKLAIDTAKAIGAEICGIDILESPFGPKVIEVNLSPGLQGITAATKLDIADMIANFLYKKTKEIKDKDKQTSSSKILHDLGIGESSKEIIMNLDFRAGRIFLPEVITKLSKFNDKDDVTITSSNKNITIKKLDVKS